MTRTHELDGPDTGSLLRRYGWLLVMITMVGLFAAMLFPNAVLGTSRWFGLSAADTRICFEPEYAEIGVGMTQTVSLMVYDVENLFAVQMILRFDPARIQIVDVNPGQGGVQVGVGEVLSPTQTTLDGYLFQTVNNVEGTIDILASYAQPDPPFSGSGSLLEITFLGVGGGSSEWTFDNLVLSNKTGDDFNQIDVDVCSSTVVVLDGTYTPEPTLTPTATPTLAFSDTATLFVSPAHRDVSVGMTTTVDIVAANVEDLYGVSFELSFDPTLVQVVDSSPISAGVQIALGGLISPDFVAMNEADNVAGTIMVAFGQFGSPPPPPASGTGTVARIVFTGTHSGLSPIHFEESMLSDPDGLEIEATTTDGEILVLGQSTIIGRLSFQGRPGAPSPRWVTPISVTLVTSGGGPEYHYDAVTDVSGVFTLTNILSGTYDIQVRDLHSLWNVRRGRVLNLGPNTVNLGTLVEGDANHSETIDVVDFSLLASTYDTSAGPGWDPRADFNNSGHIDVYDFSLLASNFGRSGKIILNP